MTGPLWEAADPVTADLIDGGLFGAVSAGLTPALFDPVAVVAVNGVDVASGAANPDDRLMVVDGVTVTWGRDEVMDQAVPATGRLVLFDATRTWATGTDRRGQPVTVRYTGTAPDGSTVSAIYFRGRIGSPVTVRAKTVHHPTTGERIDGALVELPLQSALVDLANITPLTAFPAETMGARIDRLVVLAQAAGLLTGGANVRDYWRAPEVGPVAAADQVSLLAHFTACFDSAGADAFTYRPHTDTLRHVSRRFYSATNALGRLWWETDPLVSPRAGLGAFLRGVTLGGLADQEEATGLYLDAATLEYDPADGIATPAQITRAVLDHPDGAAAYVNRTVELPVRREPWDPAGGNTPLEDARGVGVRAVRVDSIVANRSYAEVSLADTEQLARREGSRWRLAPLRLTTRKLGGFETVAVAQHLLSGYERQSHFFLQRSGLPGFGLRPVFGVMGATVVYARGGWDLELTLAPVVTETRQHLVTFEDLNVADTAYRLEAWDTPHPKGIHPTMTFEDMRFCGALQATALPETAKDEYQT